MGQIDPMTDVPTTPSLPPAPPVAVGESLPPAPPSAAACALEPRDRAALTRWIATEQRYVDAIRERLPTIAALHEEGIDLVQRALLAPLALTSAERNTLTDLLVRCSLAACLKIRQGNSRTLTARHWAEEALAFDALTRMSLRSSP